MLGVALPQVNELIHQLLNFRGRNVHRYWTRAKHRSAPWQCGPMTPRGSVGLVHVGNPRAGPINQCGVDASSACSAFGCSEARSDSG